jgi:Ca-activated chloride channel family protein
MKRGILQLGYLICIFGLWTATAMGNATETGDRTLAPYFFIESDHALTDPFPLKETTVSVKINGVIADVSITQTYMNNGSDPLHGQYIFPASTRAAVHGMYMTIGEHTVTARIKERKTAQQTFKTAKKEGKSASLLEQQRPNVFSMNVANIMPGDTVDIELRYTEYLVPTGGIYAFVFPTVVGPRYAGQQESMTTPVDRWIKSPYLPEDTDHPTVFRMGVQITSGIPIADIACPSHRIETIWENEKTAEILLAESEKNGGNRDFILNYRLAGKKIQSGLMLYEGKTENFFLLMAEPPGQVQPDTLPPREYIFVVDVSGSMHGFPLNTAKTLLRRLISSLDAGDRFNLLLFAGGSRLMSPTSLSATSDNIRQAIGLIDETQGGGGTELYQALKRGLALPHDDTTARTILIITDGYISAEKDVFQLIHNNLDTANLFAFGIGSSVNRYLIEGMASAGQGAPFVVTDPGHALQAVDQFRQYVASPVLTHIKLGFDGFTTYDVEPTHIPDLFASRPIVVFGKWRGRPEGTIRISGMTGNGSFQQSLSVTDTRPLAANSALPYLWARKRIARLSDFGHGENKKERRAEVTSLGLTYNLLTPYTSFVAVDNRVRNRSGQAKTVKQPLPLPLHVSNLAVGSVNVPEPELALLLVVAGLILVIGYACCRRRVSVA